MEQIEVQYLAQVDQIAKMEKMLEDANKTIAFLKHQIFEEREAKRRSEQKLRKKLMDLSRNMRVVANDY